VEHNTTNKQQITPGGQPCTDRIGEDASPTPAINESGLPRGTTPAGESHADPNAPAPLVAGDDARAAARASRRAGDAEPAAGDEPEQSSIPVAGDQARKAAR
jgi:hypothetical protein